MHDVLHGEVRGSGRRHRRPAQRRGGGLQPRRGGRRRRIRRRPGGPWRRPAALGDQPGLSGGLLGHRRRPTPTCRWPSTPQGRRLAKRDGAVTLADLAAVGIEPRQVLGMHRRLPRAARRGPASRTCSPCSTRRACRATRGWWSHIVGRMIIWADGLVTEVRGDLGRSGRDDRRARRRPARGPRAGLYRPDADAGGGRPGTAQRRGARPRPGHGRLRTGDRRARTQRAG